MPTVLYTPTDTQRTNCFVQEAGDKSQAAILQQGGEYALDQIKFLCGPPMNGIRKIDRYTTLTNLRNLSDMRDNDTVFLESTQSAYWYDIASTATHDGYSVVAPFSGTGRWFRVGGVPKDTSQTLVCMGSQMAGGECDIRATDGYWEQGGSTTETVAMDFTELLPGDILTEIEVYVETVSSPSSLTFYMVAQEAGAPGATTSILATQTISTTGTYNYALSHTVTAGTRIRLIALSGGGTGSWRWYGHTLSYTRSYITT